MARRSSKPEISLFPFLAVLVCTMGALIFLLLVTTRRIRHDQQSAIVVSSAHVPAFGDSITDFRPGGAVLAVSENDEAVNTDPAPKPGISLLPPATGDLNDSSSDDDPPVDVMAKRQEVDRLQQQLQVERQDYDQLVRRVAQAKQQLQNSHGGSSVHHLQLQELTHLQQQEAELRQRLNQGKTALARLQTELDAVSKTTAEGESLLKARESALVSLRQIARDSSEQTAAGTDQTVVEFSNSTGTQRSPVIINVAESGFEFLPAGIRITDSDMQGFPGNDNPLLAGIFAVHEHRQPNPGSVKPYVLLLVRPDGSLPFYAAQRTLTDAGVHFGYELLPQNQKIAAGQRKPSEVEALRKSVLAALNRRETLYSGMLAQVQQLREQYETTEDSAPEKRSMRVLPDGRLVMAEDHSAGRGGGFVEPSDGRFYAGGHAPPPKTMSVKSPFDEFRQNGDQPDQQDSNPFSAFATNDTDKPVAIANKSMPADLSSNDVIPKLDDVKVREILPRSGPLSGNMGIGGADSTAMLEHFSQKARENSNNHVVTDNATDNERTPAQDRVNPREPTGWPDSVTANHDLATRTAGPAQDSSVTAFGGAGAVTGERREESPVNPGVAPGGQGVFGDGNAGEAGFAPATDSQSFLQKFMQMVEEEKGEKTPDPMLVNLLNQGREMASPTSGPSPETTPAATVPRALSPMEQMFGPRAGPTTAPPPPTASSSPPSWPPTLDERTASQPENNTTIDARPQDASPVAELKSPTPTPTESTPPPRFQLFTDDEAAKSALAAKSPPPAAAATSTSVATNATSVAKTPESGSPSEQQRTYFVIKIYVERNRLTIGDFEEIDTTRWGADERLAMTLEAVSSIMDDVWANVRKDALPAVRFLVGPGASEIQQTLSRQLAASNVPTRSVQELGPNLTVDQFFSAGPATTPPGPLPRNPAEPAEPAPARPRGQGRNSI